MNMLTTIDTCALTRKGQFNGKTTIPLKKLAEVLAGENTCLQRFALSVYYQSPSAFDALGWQAEHQPGVTALGDFLRERYACKRVNQEEYLPEFQLPDGFVLKGKADVVAFLEDGGVIVGDFKTGTWKSEAHWFQCALAAQGLVQAGKGSYVKAIVRQYLGQVPEVEPDISRFLGASQAALMRRVLNAVRAEWVQTTPTWTNCRFCDFKGVCGDAVLEPPMVTGTIEDLFPY
jgi:hypothetical protein